eukprot:CAMPEP_0206242872 /NCGR_PEP_ID=MMETSP0047_2-20121206/17292_1 /ASSEMBLY_ACC=CAM_ASM_000192 /TAXON_ID=195065 /ORGANISM="Chroomonas mesostigmatica_cf, Strain CCMP1168" /LENGTH=64 /DNA_ID=CAMNT_0053667927 /DNA_START=332 /DNA_END=526 /DNA_ORIENTATION=-
MDQPLLMLCSGQLHNHPIADLIDRRVEPRTLVTNVPDRRSLLADDACELGKPPGPVADRNEELH